MSLPPADRSCLRLHGGDCRLLIGVSVNAAFTRAGVRSAYFPLFIGIWPAPIGIIMRWASII